MKNFIILGKNTIPAGRLIQISMLLIALNLNNSARSNEISTVSEKSLQTTNEVDFKICLKSNSDCISGDTALRDLYGRKNISTLTSLGLIGNKSIVHIKQAIRYQSEKDLYAIFFTQRNEINEREGVETCRACPIRLGIVIYQYNNKWKLFALNNEVAETGEWGELGMVPKSLKIYSISTERFLISFSESSIAQGYGSTITNFIQVNTNWLDKISTAATVDISFLGHLVTAESSCGAKSDGESWSSDLMVKRTNSLIPIFQLKRRYADCEGKTSRKIETVNYRYNNLKKKFEDY